ncbi:GNAT family N-acetyltransferase [Aerococcaceae bacterium NML160702]|nr:GNAT family N-acetyltransferase [Aerococcaceae bacterium NML160702]
MLTLSKLKPEDYHHLWQIGFTETNPEWKKWDAPYFDDYQPLSFEEFQQMRMLSSENVRGIYVNGEVIGIVSRYWENEATRWLSIGIVIYNPNYWQHGYGTTALKLWITDTFATFPTLARVGLVTWSGNERMMKAATRIGMQLEGRIRKVRYYNGYYYDSMQYGVLREEWQ